MSTKAGEEFVKEIEYSKNRIKKYEEMWDRIVPEQITSTYFSMGLNARHIAIYNLLLGNKEEAIKWFEKAAEYYSKSRVKGRDGEVQIVMWSLLTSLLSKNKDLMDKSAKIIDDLDHRTPSYFYHFVSCLANLIIGNEDIALKNAEKLEELEPTNYSKLKYYRGLGKTCRGIIKKDSNLVKSGLTDILRRHKSLVPSLGKTMDDALVCIPATGLLLLAKIRGTTVNPREIEEAYKNYIPWLLLSCRLAKKLVGQEGNSKNRRCS